MEKLPNRAYYVFSDQDDTVLVALDVKFDNKRTGWFDTIKERIMTIEKIIDSDPQRFIFKRAPTEGGGIYTFVPMTLEIYKEKVKKHMIIPREFNDSEEMFSAFEETRKNAW